MKYTITGATGHLGRKVVEQMSSLVDVREIRLAVHTPSKAQNFLDQGNNFRREDTRTCSGDESSRQSTEKVLFIWFSFPMVV